jgi:RNA 2',3'-cyclic 3'-phosphodiesterase
MPRLFVAIDVPLSFKQTVSEHHRPLTGVRWTKADNLHLTLKFIGDTEVERTQDIHEGLEGLSVRPFALKTSHPLLLPSQRKARVLALAIEPSIELESVRNQVEERVSGALGVKADTRPFRPHITLGRFKSADADAIQKARALVESVEPVTFNVSQVTLYESRLDPQGARHHVLATFDLTQ